jgi:SAM-dependent methyltransferase
MKKLLIFSMLLITCTYVGYSESHHKKVFLWLDAHANFQRLGTQAGVIRILNKAKSVGFTDVVLDVKSIDGYMLYPTKIGVRLTVYKGFKRASDYDYPAVVLKNAHKLGMGVYFSMNVFTEGDRQSKTGIAYNEQFKNWQVQVYTKDGIVPISKSSEGDAIYVNPVLPEVCKYELSLIKEIVKMYKPDGIILDHARYPNISGDFSRASKIKFEKFIGEKVNNWPEDIYKIELKKDDKIDRVPGLYYKQWLVWRAKVIHDFFLEAKSTIKDIDPNVKFGDYVGAWYPLYFDVGVNWASDKYRTYKDYDWADKSYSNTGYAQILDLLMVGNYFYDVTEEEAIKSHTPSPDSSKAPGYYWWYSVDGSAKIAKKVVGGVTPVLGSLYVQQYLDKNNPTQFIRAIRTVLRNTNGLMIFDLVHLDRNNWWDYVKDALNK